LTFTTREILRRRTIRLLHLQAGHRRHPWINTACEGDGAYVWWPNKEQWRDEPQEGMLITIAVPNGLNDVSNGKFMGKKDLGDGYTRWDWMVHYPSTTTTSPEHRQLRSLRR